MVLHEICSIGGEPNELFQHPLRKSAGRNGTREYRYRPDGESAAHQSGHDGAETGGQIAAASGRGVPGARSVLSSVQHRSTVPGRKGRARRIKHLAQLVDYFVFLLGRCARALAAAVLLALPVRPSRSTFDAAVAALALVCLELRNVLPPFFGELYAVLVTRHTLNIQHIALNIKRYSIFSIQKEEKTPVRRLQMFLTKFIRLKVRT